MPINPDEVPGEFKRFFAKFDYITDRYEEINPAWEQITFSQIIYKAVATLKSLIENPEEKNVTWENPITELRYPVLADWEKVEPQYFHLSEKDIEGPERFSNKLLELFITVKDVFVLRNITKEILVIIQEGKAFYKLPLALHKKLAKLSKEERFKRIERILRPAAKPGRIMLNEIPRKGKRRAGVYLIAKFSPCVLNVDEGRAYYPIIIGLEFKGLRPSDLDEESRAALLEGLLAEIEKATPEEKLDFLREPGPEPEVKPVTKEAPLVKVGLHAELQKFGHRQLGLFDSLLRDGTNKEITEKKIEVIGLDITQAQNQALFAIQKLLTETNYRGNIPGQDLESHSFHFKGYLPALEFTPAQYLEAYGIATHKTERGKEEFSSRARGDALQALIDLARKNFLFVYKRKHWEKNKAGKREEQIDRIETITPLLRIIRGWEGLTKYEDASLDKGQANEAADEKLKAIAIEPAPILVQDINSYFVLKPANYLQEINLLYPWPKRPSKFAIRFIDWLIAQAELKRRSRAPLVIEESFEGIARHLRMDAYITTNQFKRIRQILNNCYKAARDLGYLLSYETIQGKAGELERLGLNPEKFKRVKAIEEERKRLEAKGNL